MDSPIPMKFYCCRVNVERKSDHGNTSKQIPLFYLNSEVQGIVSQEHAVKIINDMFNPFQDKNIVVHCNVEPMYMKLFFETIEQLYKDNK